MYCGHVAGAEVRHHGKHGTHRVVCHHAEVEVRNRIEAILHAARVGVELVDVGSDDRSEGQLPVAAHVHVLAARRIVEDARADAQDGSGAYAIGEAEARREVVPVRLHARGAIRVEAGDQKLSGNDVKVGLSVGDLHQRRVEFIAQPDVEGKPVADLPVILHVETPFGLPEPGVDEREVLFDEVGRAQQKRGHRLTGGGCIVRIVGERAAEVEPAVAAVGLVLRHLAAADVEAEFEGVRAAEIGEVDARVEGIFDADDRQRARLADAGIAAGADDRNAVGCRTLVGSTHSEFLAQLRAGRGAFLREIQVEPVETHLGFHDEGRREGADPDHHRVVGDESGVAGKGVFVAQTDGHRSVPGSVVLEGKWTAGWLRCPAARSGRRRCYVRSSSSRRGRRPGPSCCFSFGLLMWLLISPASCGVG